MKVEKAPRITDLEFHGKVKVVKVSPQCNHSLSKKVEKTPRITVSVFHGKVKVWKVSPRRNHLLWKVKAQHDTIAHMETSARNLELTEADLHGHAPEDLACNQCGGAFCGSRAGRILEGKPFIMCGQKEEVKEILSSIGRR